MGRTAWAQSARRVRKGRGTLARTRLSDKAIPTQNGGLVTKQTMAIETAQLHRLAHLARLDSLDVELPDGRRTRVCPMGLNYGRRPLGLIEHALASPRDTGKNRRQPPGGDQVVAAIAGRTEHQRVAFAARDDMFLPGFFAGFPAGLPPRVRRLLYPLGVAGWLPRVEVFPIRSARVARLAEVLADRVAIMDRGKIVRLETPRALIAALLARGFSKPAVQQQANLEDVFIDLTGHALRDEMEVALTSGETCVEACLPAHRYDEVLQYRFAKASQRAAALRGLGRVAEAAERGVRRGDVVMTVIGNRPEWVYAMVACWRIGAVAQPCAEQLRPSDLRARMDAVEPRAVLAKRLARLVDEGLMVKHAYAERPLRYEYRLTDKGRAFWDVLAAMFRWGSDWLWEGKGPPVMLVDHATGNEVRPLVVDEHTGKRLDVRRLRVARARRQ